MCVPMQDNVDIVRRLVRRDMLQTEFQSTAHKIDDQWPFEIAVAISTYVRNSRPNRAKLVENAFRANISKMPDFIRTLGNFLYFFRETIVRVRENKNAQRLFGRGFFLVCHVKQSLA